MKRFRFVLTLLFVLAVTLPIVAQDDEEGFDPNALHTECAEDLTGESITFYHLGDLSGPLSPLTEPNLFGFEDAARWFNENGGLCGAEIILPDPTTIDTGFDQSVTSNIYERIIEDDPVSIALYSSDDSELLRARAEEDEVVLLVSAGSIEALYGSPENGFTEPAWVFATNPLYVDLLGGFCEWAVENHEEPVIGYIGWESAFGRAAFTPEALEYCNGIGATMLEEAEFFAPGGDASGAVQNLYDRGANILYMHVVGAGPSNLAATVNNLGLADELQLAGVTWILDNSVAYLGQSVLGPEGLPVTNGMIGQLPFTWWSDADNPAIAFLVEQADRNNRIPDVRGFAYIASWMNFDLWMEVYIQTGNRVGFENVDGAAFKETLENITYAPLDLATIDYQGGELRDPTQYRVGVMNYLGEDGTAATLPDNPPVLEDGPEGPRLVPFTTPITEFRDTPDLRPGMFSIDEE